MPPFHEMLDEIVYTVEIRDYFKGLYSRSASAGNLVLRFFTALRRTHQWLAAVLFVLAVACESNAYAGCGDHLIPLIGQTGQAGSARYVLQQSIRLESEHFSGRPLRCDGPGCGQTPSSPGADISAPTTVARSSHVVVVARTTNDIVLIPTCCFGWMQSNLLQLSQCVPSGPFRPPRWA